MSDILTLSGWAQPADAVAQVIGDATSVDYSDYPSPAATFAELKNRSRPRLVVGWSMGGELAIRAILAGVLKPEKLILLAAPYQFVSGGSFNGGMDPVTYRQFRDSYARDPARTRQRFHALVAKGDARSREVMAQLTHHPQVDDTARWLPWLQQLGAGSLRDVDLAALPPTLIIHGTNDHIVPIAQGEMLAGRIPGAQLQRWEEAGHAPHLHDKLRLLQVIETFAA